MLFLRHLEFDVVADDDDDDHDDDAVDEVLTRLTAEAIFLDLLKTVPCCWWCLFCCKILFLFKPENDLCKVLSSDLVRHSSFKVPQVLVATPIVKRATRCLLFRH